MLKLPLCPYCEARFLYSTVRDSRKQKTGVCPHCNKEFQVSRRGSTALLLLIAFLIMVTVNWLLLTIPAINLPFLMVITAIGVMITYFLLPYTVRYKKL